MIERFRFKQKMDLGRAEISLPLGIWSYRVPKFNEAEQDFQAGVTSESVLYDVKFFLGVHKLFLKIITLSRSIYFICTCKNVSCCCHKI